jgi:branched-chain amino acid transport system permease protein
LTRFLEHFFIGLSSGSIYALLALGLVIVYRGSGHLNFAQGEMATASAFFAWWFSGRLPIWIAVLLASVVGFIGAAIIERFIIRPIGHRSQFAVVVAAIGLFLGIDALTPFAFKVSKDLKFPSIFPSGSKDYLSIGGTQWYYENIGALLLLIVVAGGLFLLFQKTKLGLAMRAVASNPESAPLVGIKTGNVLMVSWGLAAFVGALGGATVASINGVLTPTMMFAVFFSATAAATLGGFDSIGGAVLGGVVLGIVEEMSAGYAPGIIGNDLKFGVSLLIILVVLLVRPSGLFGSQRVERV